MPESEESISKIFVEIAKRQNEFVEKLREAVKIPSVSGQNERRDDCVKMVNWAEEEMKNLGIETRQYVPIDTEKKPDEPALPPVILGTLGKDSKKKTLLVYGHLDVQPAAKADGWDTEPFEMVEKDGKLYGRGTTDDKGPVLAWLNTIKVMQDLKIEIPVNLKFCIESMEESGSKGLEAVLKQTSFCSGVDFTCISDNYWLGQTKPCITYGLRGLCYYAVEVICAKQDLHSGVFGGSIPEGLNDLIYLMSKLTAADGKILVTGLNELVAPVTPEEEQAYKTIDFNKDTFRKEIGAFGLSKDSEMGTLMNRWRYPSLSLHGIAGAYSGDQTKTIIPYKVTGKFSIRIVPNMKPEKVDELVFAYLEKLWKERGSPNKYRAWSMQRGEAWLGDIKDVHFQAGAWAVKRVFGVEPDFTREGGSIPVTLTLKNLTGKSVMLLPIGANDDMAHSQNEKINRQHYINGHKTLASYLMELGDI